MWRARVLSLPILLPLLLPVAWHLATWPKGGDSAAAAQILAHPIHDDGPNDKGIGIFVIVIFICSAWPMLIDTAFGVAGVGRDWLNVAKTLEVSRRRRRLAFEFILPRSTDDPDRHAHRDAHRPARDRRSRDACRRPMNTGPRARNAEVARHSMARDRTRAILHLDARHYPLRNRLVDLLVGRQASTPPEKEPA